MTKAGLFVLDYYFCLKSPAPGRGHYKRSVTLGYGDIL
jgi:hypothetical protein